MQVYMRNHRVYMLKIITGIKIHRGGHADLSNCDNGHTLNILEFI